MSEFSPACEAKLLTCDERLQRLMRAVNAEYPCLIAYGHRDQDAQNKAKVGGFSKVGWPHSPHNAFPSLAVDACPLPLDWDNLDAFKKFAAFVLQKADELGIAVRWGGSFKTLPDFDHFELVNSGVGNDGHLSTSA